MQLPPFPSSAIRHGIFALSCKAFAPFVRSTIAKGLGVLFFRLDRLQIWDVVDFGKSQVARNATRHLTYRIRDEVQFGRTETVWHAKSKLGKRGIGEYLNVLGKSECIQQAKDTLPFQAYL